MIHIQPIREGQVSGSISQIYQEVKLTLGTDSVPTYFQYLANYDDVLAYFWQNMKQLIQSEKFSEATDVIIRNSLKTVIEVYKPSEQLIGYIQHMNSSEKEEKTQDVLKLLQVQAKMLLVEIQIREAIKGMPIVGSKTQAYLSGSREPLKDQVDEETKEIITSQSLAIQNKSEFEYDSFFERVEQEIKTLVTQKNYLEARVDFEKSTLFMLLQGAFPFEISYNEFREMLIGKSYIPELIFLLKDVFPSNAPRQVYTAALMNYLLNME